MSEIFKNGSGNVAPKQKQPPAQQYQSSVPKSQDFRVQNWDNSPGNNLVINRKSLNVEATKTTKNKIREGNLQFLQKLQSLKPTYNTDDFIQQHRERGHLVERISRYPLILDHNCKN